MLASPRPIAVVDGLEGSLPPIQHPRPDGTIYAVPHCDRLMTADARRNPSSFDAFTQHVHLTDDTGRASRF